MSLFVGNISSRANARELEGLFKRFGDCRVDLKHGFGFVDFVSHDDAGVAKDELHGRLVAEQSIVVEWSRRTLAQPSGPPPSKQVRGRGSSQYGRGNHQSRNGPQPNSQGGNRRDRRMKERRRDHDYGSYEDSRDRRGRPRRSSHSRDYLSSSRSRTPPRARKRRRDYDSEDSSYDRRDSYRRRRRDSYDSYRDRRRARRPSREDSLSPRRRKDSRSPYRRRRSRSPMGDYTPPRRRDSISPIPRRRSPSPPRREERFPRRMDRSPLGDRRAAKESREPSVTPPRRTGKSPRSHESPIEKGDRLPEAGPQTPKIASGSPARNFVLDDARPKENLQVPETSDTERATEKEPQSVSLKTAEKISPKKEQDTPVTADETEEQKSNVNSGETSQTLLKVEMESSGSCAETKNFGDERNQPKQEDKVEEKPGDAKATAPKAKKIQEDHLAAALSEDIPEADVEDGEAAKPETNLAVGLQQQNGEVDGDGKEPKIEEPSEKSPVNNVSKIEPPTSQKPIAKGDIDRIHDAPSAKAGSSAAMEPQKDDNQVPEVIDEKKKPKLKSDTPASGPVEQATEAEPGSASGDADVPTEDKTDQAEEDPLKGTNLEAMTVKEIKLALTARGFPDAPKLKLKRHCIEQLKIILGDD